MDLEPPVLLDHNNALEALPPGDSLDMGVKHPEDFFCHNTTEKLPPEDLDLERQCTGPGDTRPNWWRRIWGRILSLIFKTEASAALSRADSNMSSTPNTRVHSIQPTIEAMETNLVEQEATFTAGLTRAKPDSESIPTFEETISVRSPQPLPPPPPDTHDPHQDGLLDDRELAASYTSVHSDQPTIDTVREANLAEPSATYTDLPPFDKTIRINSRSPSPPPSSDTLEDPGPDGLLTRSQLIDLVLFIKNAGCISPRISSDRSTARERDSTTIPPYMYQPHSEVCKNTDSI